MREKAYGLVRLTDLEGNPVFIDASTVTVIGPRKGQMGGPAEGALVVLEGGISVFVQETVVHVARLVSYYIDPETGLRSDDDPDLVVDASKAVVNVNPILVGNFGGGEEE